MSEPLKLDLPTMPVTSAFDAYFELMEGTSESPIIYHRWTLISSVAAMLGRESYLNFGFETIYPNMYVCLLGNAGTRKSSAINIAKKLVSATGYNKFARERSSKEKFIKDLSEGFDIINGATADTSRKDKAKEALEALEDIDARDHLETSEVFITAGELEDFLGQGDGAFISLLTTMWDNLPHYAHGKMTSADLYIHEPTVSLLGGATPTTFNSVFPPEVIGQGFMSRLLLVYGAGVHKKLTIPAKPDDSKLADFTYLLREIKATCKGEFTYDDEAFEVFDTIYQGEIDLKDYRLESYINRRHTHFLKLCMVVAALNLTKVITKDIAILANSILHYTERDMSTALGEFGKNIKGDTNTRFIQAVETWHSRPENAGKMLSPEILFPLIQTDYNDFLDFGKAMQKLLHGHKIEYDKRHGRGLILNENGNVIPMLPFTDFSLLPENNIRKL